MTENKNRCVITGLGVICAIGNNVEETWKNAVSGVSGIKEVKSVNTQGCYSVQAAEVEDPTLDTLPDADKMDRVSRLCIKAATEAVKDSGIDMNLENHDRVSVIIGSCVGGVNSIENYYKAGENKEDIPKMVISAIANDVAKANQAGGVITNIGNACAAGTISISYACDLIRAGKSDVVLAGGADAYASVPYAGFTALHALDERPCAPFNRFSGITLGEGSGVLVVESYEHAKARGAKIYCEVLSAGVSSDAHHITSPREDGEGQMNCINWAIKNSGIPASEIKYVNAHGTGTAKNDQSEFLSLHTVFDETNDDLSVSSTKAMVGHCLGAAGSVEAVFSIKALTEGVVPPTVNYTEEELETLKERAGKIDFRANVSRKKEMDTVMSNSFAFGGNNASIIFSKKEGNVTLPEEENVYITGFGIVSPLGNHLEAAMDAIKNHVPAQPNMESAVAAPDFAEAGLKMAFYRKLDKFSQLQAVSGMLALKNAGITVTDENATDIGIAVGTSEGPLSTVCSFQQEILEKGNAGGSAFKFPNTVYNAAGGYLSICSGIKGYNVTVTNGAQSGLSSIAYATQVLRHGKAKIMLATGSDENSEIMKELFDKLSLTEKEAVKAYSKGAGFNLSDGSITLILETESSMKERGAKAYAQVKGYGMAHKSVDFGTISGSAEGLKKAVLLAIEDAGISLSDIGAISGFANGCAQIDEIELDVYKELFKDKLPEIPVLAVKDTFGEGRAAAAAMSAVVAANVLAKEATSLYAYRISEEGIQEEKTDLSSVENMLVTSYGSGGSYCALILG
ncbi:MAG: beta-ketoacyl-[acyl-carrier-protein] synthase family protein [Lachnospiraceae bacterium]|nr:beta-ketoacyl-[acyl-carrier-protein] synthase family protein [Lachnospiraceae bacterium]